MKSMLLGAICLAAMTGAANAQIPYSAALPYQPAPPPSLRYPPSWSYDPYTSGQTACPQKRPGDVGPCSQIMPPTYGQPSYWSTR